MNKATGGPAFARPFSKGGEYSDSPKYHAQDGMTLRDYFAAKASDNDLAEIRQDWYANWISQSTNSPTPPTFRPLSTQEARYMHADAMLAERAK